MNKRQTEKFFLSFISELDILLNNGFDILSSLKLFKSSLKEKEPSFIMEKVIQKVQSGTSVTESLFSEEFSNLPLFYKVIFSSAEKSGTFSQAARQMKVFIVKKEAFENHMKRILVYPLITISIAFIALFIVLFHFLPSLSLIYRDMETELPSYAKYLLLASEKFSFLSVILLIFVLSAIIAVFVSLLKKKQMLIKIKPFSDMIKWFQCYFLSFHFFMLLNADMDFMKSLEVLSESNIYPEQFKKMQTEIKNGEKVEKSFKSAFSLPASFLESLSLGMKSGRLKNTFNYLFESAQLRLENNMSLAVAIIEPVLILLTALIVGIVVYIGLYPLLTLSNIANI